ncbi:MAG: hypothetical protein QXW97_01360 [Candidatus Pacearchaeota archaeon]
MRNKAILVSFIALFAMTLTLAVVSATDFVTVTQVRANDVVLQEGAHIYIGQVSDVVPIEVQFASNANVNEYVKVKVYIEGFKEDIEKSIILRTPLEAGVEGYVARLSIKLPSTMDIEDLKKDIILNVRISAQGQDSVEKQYTIRMQRDLYSLNILSIEAPDKVIAGSVVPFTIVVQNNGNERLNNVYVKASIPELGIVRNVYFGDLAPTEETDYESIRDTTERNVYLTIPRNAAPGTYNVQIEAYNYDTSTIATKKIVIGSIESGAIPTSYSQSIAIGEEASFDIVLVNPSDKLVVYSVTPEKTTGLTITVDQPIVAVPAEQSKTVNVKVKATSSAQEGTNLVTVNINSETGLVKQVPLTVNVKKTTTSENGGTTTPITASNGVLILTVILVIIFVVLLIVLIVLLTRKPAETEEFGETSYY